MAKNRIKASIIIACYNEELVLEQNLNEIINVMDNTSLDYEIILVDDRSEDNTLLICRKFIDKYPNFRLLTHERNRGRGKTVADGIESAKGEIAAFIDIDLETPAHYLPPLFKLILDGADIGIAERIYKIKVHSLHRWILSKGYMFLVRILCKTPTLDTESGCKAFNREKILPILSECQDEKWFWDTETVVRAYYKNLKIMQIPTLFIRKREIPSTVKLFRDSVRQFVKLIQFAYNIRKNKLKTTR